MQPSPPNSEAHQARSVLFLMIIFGTFALVLSRAILAFLAQRGGDLRPKRLRVRYTVVSWQPNADATAEGLTLLDTMCSNTDLSAKIFRLVASLIIYSAL